MKKLLFFFLAAAMFSATACGDAKKGEGEGTDSTATDSSTAATTPDESGSSSDDLVGTWSLSDLNYDMGQEMTEEMQAMMEPIIQTMKDNMSMTFNADGSYSMAAPNPMEDGEVMESAGTWEITEDGKILKTQEEGKEKVDEMNIAELSSSKMVCTMTAENMTTTMTMTKN